MNKVCSECQKEKAVTEFNRQAKAKDGLKPICKSCDSKLNKARYEAKKKKIITQNKRWQKKNKERVLDYKKRYRDKKSDGEV